MRQDDRHNGAMLPNIARELDRIARDVANLTASVNRLSGRITPFDDERTHTPTYIPLNVPRKPQPEPTIKTVLEAVRALSRRMDAPIRELQFIAARIDQISNDAWSRDDLKQYLDLDRPRKK
ncbi:hypothetical protein V5F49_20340 [Xanthobacter sp. V3C-3]|uniref:hypothetical protein n=1 Tax=Xanthobacter lutulentifluminis TaxID=3119935 RepID=UPI003729B64A